MRLAITILFVATTPVLAAQPDRQPLINITRGSPATPGGVALLTMATNSLSNASAGQIHLESDGRGGLLLKIPELIGHKPRNPIIRP